MKDRHRLAFFLNGGVPVEANTIDARPLGGTETALIRLAEELESLACQVVVFTPHLSPKLSKPLYVSISRADKNGRVIHGEPLLVEQLLHDLGQVDVFTVVRDWRALFLRVEAKKRFFWSGDAYDQFATFGLGDKRCYSRVDKILTVSDWQGDTFRESANIPKDYFATLRNGVKNALFELGDATPLRNRFRLVYTSTPYRGLALLSELFPIIKKEEPRAELHIYSGLDVYSGVTLDLHAEASSKKVLATLSKLEGCFLHGNIKQAALAKELLASSILAYPCTFLESSCIAAIEAMRAGVVPVTSNLGALPETIGDGGIVIDHKFNTPQFKEKFIESCLKVMRDENFSNSLRTKAIARGKEHDWSIIAKRFLAIATNTSL